MATTDVEQETGTVLAERRGAVLVLTLNRPERLNAWTRALERRYFDLLEEGERDPEVRAIVVTGAGRGFCAGADMEDLQTLSSGAAGDGQTLTRERSVSFPLTLRKPLIAAINGAAAGLGFVQALYCDIRFCTPEAKLTTAFARRGLIAEYGLAWLLPRLVGTSRALDLILSARVMRGEEAYRIGLVDHLAPADGVLDAALAYAEDMVTKCSPASMAVMKEQVRGDHERGFAEAFTEAERLMVESFTRADVREGVTSFVEGRPPEFPPLGG